MKKSSKAVLWSLVVPGAGQAYLKHYLRSIVPLLPSLLALGLFVRGLLEQAQFVMDKVESGAVALDPVAIAAMLDSAPDTTMTTIAFWVLVVCWVGATVDAYLLGAKQDKENGAATKG